MELTQLLLEHSVETEADVAEWLTSAENVESLKMVRGIGPKSVDYFKMLVGIPAVAVDRHLRQFVAAAGIGVRDYSGVQDLINKAASQLGANAAGLDYAIWLYVSSQPQQVRRIAA
ncbi:MAG: hypothetical protein DWQ35_13850 [Planctomycetota bacterium]|nr:MAG: hypothetical protein DWQ35_13850 [Planctomycetota bacterium]REK46911.1 MAG: hypothetical protein DWQ46_05295 [Planctomycetota bacterium]